MGSRRRRGVNAGESYRKDKKLEGSGPSLIVQCSVLVNKDRDFS